MTSVINSNIASLNAQRNLTSSQTGLQTSLQRLSSGLRINSAKDDAAGLAISQRMTSQINGLNQAARNANDGVSLAQTAEGALGSISDNLQRMRDLAVQSRNSTNSLQDRQALQKEVDQLKSEIGRVAKDTQFNGINLLDGSFTAKAFQVGANQGQTIQIDSITNASTDKLGDWTKLASVSATVAPAGTAATSGKGVFDATSLVADFSTEKVSFDVTDGTNTSSITLDGNYATASDLNTALTTKLAADGKFTVTNNGSTFTITNAATGTGTSVSLANINADADGNSTDSSVTTLPSVTSTDGAAAGFAALSTGEFKLNGKDIIVGAATDANTRVNDLVTAINKAGADVTASNDGGKLKLVSSDPTKSINIQSSASATLTAQTGLSATTTPVAGTTSHGFADLDITSEEGADNAILAMDAALKAVNSGRADLGAVQNRFTSVVSNLQVSSENLSASRSRIQDTDFAAETANMTRNQILQQAGTAMLAQANQLPNGVMSLLR